MNHYNTPGTIFVYELTESSQHSYGSCVIVPSDIAGLRSHSQAVAGPGPRPHSLFSHPPHCAAPTCRLYIHSNKCFIGHVFCAYMFCEKQKGKVGVVPDWPLDFNGQRHEDLLTGSSGVKGEKMQIPRGGSPPRSWAEKGRREMDREFERGSCLL